MLVSKQIPRKNVQLVNRPSENATRDLYGDRGHAGAHPDGHQQGGWKPTETSVTEFCYKSMNLSLEELKNIKIIFFLIQELFR